MSKILVTTSSSFPNNQLDSFRQAFVDALVENGNEVYLLLSNKFMRSCHLDNALHPDLDGQRLLEHLRGLGLEAVISMNHSGIFPGLAEALDVPVGVWLLGGPDSLVGAGTCRENASRYKMFVTGTASIEPLRTELSCDSANVHLLPYCTDLRAKRADYQSNVSFTGSCFIAQGFNEMVCEAASNPTLKSMLTQLLDSFDSEPDLTIRERIHKHGADRLFVATFTRAHLLGTVSMNQRIRVLDAVADLGLNLYGNPEWLSVAPFLAKLALCYRRRPVNEKRHLEEIYNRSRINLDVSRVQYSDGLPWYVFDILATRGALVSDNRKGLQTTFGDIELPVYDTPAEARSVIQWLLGDEVARRQLVDRCNEAIEKAHRFLHRLEVMQSVLGLPLCGLGTRGHMCALDPGEFRRSGVEPSISRKMSVGESRGPMQSLPVQVYYDEDPQRFSHECCVQVQVFARPPERISCSIPLSNAPKYLRLDIGDYFSRHEDMQIWVEHDATGNVVPIDLKNGLLSLHQVLVDGPRVTCGYDPNLTFLNPFPGSDIRVGFKSHLLACL